MDDLLERMIDPAPPQRDTPRRRRLWSTVAIVGLAAVGVTSLTTSALFTDKDSTTSAISTGTIDLTSSQLDFVLPAGDLKPLDTVYSPVTVTNDGSLGFQYAISLLARTPTPLRRRPQAVRRRCPRSSPSGSTRRRARPATPRASARSPRSGP